MSKGLKQPLVSIIIPVYNSEKYLRRCMDSLVNQTLEDIEIIAVDDGSSDGSLSILNEYQVKFPEKVIVHAIPHVSGAGAPRNTGIEIARGDYIGFCDSDDAMDLQAAELLLDKALQDDFDIVCAPAWHISEDKKILYGELTEPISTEMLILHGQVYLWNKLVHRRIIEQAGPMPEQISYEDLGYTPVIHSYAKKIGYIDNPIYNYYKRYGSDSNTLFALRNLDTSSARQFAIDNCNPQYREYVQAFIARHINTDLRKRWVYFDHSIMQLKSLWHELENNHILKSDEYLFGRLKRLASLPDTPIPRNIFIGGFGGEISDQYVSDVKKRGFYDECNVYIINEQSCDVTENENVKFAYYSKEFGYLNEYFALKAILKDGGIYLDKRIKINAPFNYTRYCRTFFALMDENTYSDWVFGSVPNNEVLNMILTTYENSKLEGNQFAPLSSRIKETLKSYNIPLEEVNNMFDYPATIFSPDVMVCDTTDQLSLQPEPHICIHDFSDEVGKDDFVVVKRSTLRAISNLPGANDELSEVKKENAMLRNKIRNLEVLTSKDTKNDK